MQTIKKFNKKTYKLFYIAFLIFSNCFLFAEKPITIPSIKEWTDNNEQYVFGGNTRIMIDPKYKSELMKIAQTLQKDLNDLKKFEAIITVNDKPKSGDVYLTLDSSDSRLGNEGYKLLVDDVFRISGATPTGAFWATRSYLQIVKLNDRISGGIARDWPDFPERGIMLDNGRKYYTIKWLENHIKELSFFKLNMFHFHFSDNEGFRIQSEVYPEVSSEKCYSKNEIRALIKLGEEYGVQILPEIDMPSHMDQILKKHQEIALVDSTGAVICNLIDFTKDSAITFTKNLIGEYLDLFPIKYWHLGADEYIPIYDKLPHITKYAKEKFGPNATPIDAFIGYINEVNSFVKSKGKQLRIWNDGLIITKKIKNTIDLDKDVIIEYWLDDSTSNQLFDKGYTMMNCTSLMLYYDIGNYWRPYRKALYESWTPDYYSLWDSAKIDNPKNKGSKIQIWADFPETLTEGQVAIEMRNNLRILGQKNWCKNIVDSNYTYFEKRIKSIGLAPGVEFPINPIPDDIAFGKKVVTSYTHTNPDFAPEKVVDGDHETAWVAASKDSEWVYVDLEKKVHIKRVKLFWEYSYATKYLIQVSDDANEWKTIIEATNTHEFANDFTNLSCEGRYVRVFELEKIYPWGCSLYELEVYDSTLTPEGVIERNNTNNSFNVRIYPNPSSGEFNINYYLGEVNHIQIEIYDRFARKVAELVNEEKSPGKYQTYWNTEGLPSSEYYVKIKIGREIYYDKLILVK